MEHFLNNYGYLAVFIGTLLEGESILLLAGVLAHHGYMHPLGVALAAFLGSSSSDQLMFFLGRYKGAALLRRFPRLKNGVEAVGRRVHGHESILILTFRFFYGLRNATPVFLGLNGTSPRLFIPLNLLGASLWACLFTAAGYYFGQALEAAFGHLGHYRLILLAALLLIVVLVWLIRRWHKRKAEHKI